MILDLLENGKPAHIALSITGSGSAVSYGQLRQQVDALGRTLSQLGLGRGDRIAMALPNGLEVIASFLAASTVGTAAPLNPAYTRDEFQFYLEDTGARALIVPPKDGDEARAAAGDQVLIVEADLDDNGRVQFSPVRSPAFRRNSRQQQDPPEGGTPNPNADDIALILHTSGTTSRPKRVPL